MQFLKNIVSSTIGTVIGLLVAGTILIVIFVAVLVGGIFGAISELENDSVEMYSGDANVIVMSLDNTIVERGGAEPFTLNFMSMSAQAQIGLDQIIDGLSRAAQDDNIKGLVLQIDGVSAMPSTLEDIRDAIEDFKKSGKWVVAWSETMSQGAYYMNSVADEVYLHPVGGMTLQGLRSVSMFYPGLLEKLGMDVTVLRGPNNKFKSAVEPFFRKDFSEANKEQLSALLGGIWTNIKTDIATSRGISESEVDAIAEAMAIRLPGDALEHNLVDALLYEDEFDALLELKLDSVELNILSFGEYTLPERMFGLDLSDPEGLVDFFEDISSEDSSDDDSEGEELGGDIAVIYAVGAIESGEGDAATIGSVTIARALREARLAPDVKAVVLRVNSPGGSALASDVIWRETVLLKEAGKHLVVSMGDLAASGGYYISCEADRIFANPTTITGSIGVFGLIVNKGGAYEKLLDVSFDEIRTHSHAGMPDGLFAMSEYEKDAYNEMIVDIYEDFTGKVAAGRGMSSEAVEEVARGRVWTGIDALEIGLVDELGNLDDAVRYAEELIGNDDAIKIYLPEMMDPLEQMIEDMMGVHSGLEALNLLGADPAFLKEVLGVKRMIETGDIYQTRLPYTLHID
jgi:protease-4